MHTYTYVQTYTIYTTCATMLTKPFKPFINPPYI